MRTILTLGLVGLAGLLATRAAAQEQKPAGDPKEIVARLIADLEQTQSVERQVQAAMRLADLGPAAAPALPALVTALANKNEDLRLNAAIALGKVGKAAVPALRKLLDGSDKDMRFYAIWALGWVGPDAAEVAPVLVQAMADKDEGIRRKAAYALGRIAGDPQEALKVLLAAFKDESEDVRQAASDAVAKFGKAAVPGLIAALKDSDAKVRLQAAHAVAEMGTDARETAPILRKLLLGKNSDNGASVYAQALAKLGKTGVPALIAGFKDDRPPVQQASVQALTQVGAEAVPALVDALGDKKAEVRRMAVQVLAPLRVSDKMVVTALAYAVKNDTDDQVRMQCVSALSYLGASGKLAAPALHQALSDANNQVRNQAFYALQAMGEDSRPGLLKALTSKDDKIRVHTAALMLTIGVEPNSALPVLVAALEHDSDELRTQAAFALAQTRRETGKLLPFLEKGARSKTVRVRLQALQGLAMLGDLAKPAVGLVVDALKDSDMQVRQQAVVTLQSIPAGVDTILPALTRMFQEEKGVGVRQSIVQSIWRFGPKSIPLLLEALKDADPSLRQQAVWAMQNVNGDLSPYLKEILVLVRDKDDNVRLNLVNLLGRTGEAGTVELGKLLRDPNASVRMQAAAVLRGVGKHVLKVLPALAEAVQDKDANVRTHAANALAQAGGDEGVKLLVQAYGDAKNAQARAQIIQAVGYAPSRAQAVSVVAQALQDPDNNVRNTALQVLPNFGQPQAVYDALVAAFKSKDFGIRITAVQGLQSFGVKGMPLLEEGLATAKGSSLRQAILQGLINQNHRAKGAIGPLTDCLKDGQPQVRWQAAQVLGNLGADAQGAVPTLKGLLNDPNPTVRQHAQAALTRIGVPKN